jgi:tRNA (adenine22-N1)-methyltransferase
MARDKICAAGLEDLIKTRLGDGLSPLTPGEADCIVIAGMGGMRTIGILDNAPEKARLANSLILQPQHDLILLRKYLHQNGFDITDEKLAREGGRFYVILSASYALRVTPWQEKEYFLGKHLMKQNDNDLQLYLTQERDKIKGYINSINDKNAWAEALMRLEWVEREVEKNG